MTFSKYIFVGDRLVAIANSLFEAFEKIPKEAQYGNIYDENWNIVYYFRNGKLNDIIKTGV